MLQQLPSERGDDAIGGAQGGQVAGTVQRSGYEEGTVLAPGEHVVTIVSRREQQKLVAEYGGTVLEWLVEDGDPVSPGQPLVRIHPRAEAAV